MSATMIEASRRLEQLLYTLSQRLPKPIYLEISERAAGQIDFRQVEFLSVEEFAALCKVERRTVYTWIEKNLFRFSKPPGTGQVLIALTDALAWIEAGKVKEVR